MNAKLQFKNVTTNYVFDIEHEGKKYHTTVWLNDKGKFIDDTIYFNNRELEYEGNEGEIREDILTYLDENWDKLTAAAAL